MTSCPRVAGCPRFSSLPRVQHTFCAVTILAQSSTQHTHTHTPQRAGIMNRTASPVDMSTGDGLPALPPTVAKSKSIASHSSSHSGSASPPALASPNPRRGSAVSVPPGLRPGGTRVFIDQMVEEEWPRNEAMRLTCGGLCRYFTADPRWAHPACQVQATYHAPARGRRTFTKRSTTAARQRELG